MSFKEDSLTYFRISEHMMGMTYNLNDDPKLLKSVVANLHKSLKFIMFHMTRKEEEYETSMMRLKPLLMKYKLSLSYLDFLKDVNYAMIRQKESEIEFSRRNKYVFASPDYKLYELKKKDVEEYLLKGKLFINQVLDVIE